MGAEKSNTGDMFLIVREYYYFHRWIIRRVPEVANVFRKIQRKWLLFVFFDKTRLLNTFAYICITVNNSSYASGENL